MAGRCSSSPLAADFTGCYRPSFPARLRDPKVSYRGVIRGRRILEAAYRHGAGDSIEGAGPEGLLQEAVLAKEDLGRIRQLVERLRRSLQRRPCALDPLPNVGAGLPRLHLGIEDPTGRGSALALLAFEHRDGELQPEPDLGVRPAGRESSAAGSLEGAGRNVPAASAVEGSDRHLRPGTALGGRALQPRRPQLRVRGADEGRAIDDGLDRDRGRDGRRLRGILHDQIRGGLATEQTASSSARSPSSQSSATRFAVRPRRSRAVNLCDSRPGGQVADGTTRQRGPEARCP